MCRFVTPRRRAAFIVFALAASSAMLAAQSPERPQAPCGPVPKAEPTDSQKREAHAVAEQARQASITDGSRTARDLFKRAVQLDPTDANNVYALARLYDDAKEPRPALAEYCRFLAIAPSAPEVPDIKARVAALSQELTRLRAENAPRFVPPPETLFVRTPNDNSVFALATVMPGLAQYYTKRPIMGAAVTAASLGALYWGLQSDRRANTAAGVTLSVGISALGAMEAYLHAHTPRSRAPRARH